MENKELGLRVEEIELMSEIAWNARENALIRGSTKVGAAAMSASSAVFPGCNIEHRFRSHDIHAEVNAIGSMVAAGQKKLSAILVVAEREEFLPCGACMDWIFEVGGSECLVGFQGKLGGEVKFYRASELMPHYPH